MKNEFKKKAEEGLTLNELKKQGKPLSERESQIRDHDNKMREEGKSAAGPDQRAITRGEANKAMERTNKDLLQKPRPTLTPRGPGGANAPTGHNAPATAEKIKAQDEKHSQKVVAERVRQQEQNRTR